MFQDQLLPKVVEIDRLAQEMYRASLVPLGLTVDGTGTVLRDPNTGIVAPPISDLAPEQERYNGFVSTLWSVIARFESHYHLDTLDLIILVGRLGKPGSAVSAPGTVVGRIHTADDVWMRPVLELIHRKDWSSDAAQAFHDNVLDPYHRAAGVQMACTTILTIAAQAFHDGTTKVQDDLLAIADAAVGALGQMATPGPAASASSRSGRCCPACRSPRTRWW